MPSNPPNVYDDDVPPPIPADATPAVPDCNPAETSVSDNCPNVTP